MTIGDSGAAVDSVDSSVSPGLEWIGWCSICERSTVFSSKYHWFRDHLRCSGCESHGGSLPRDRAVAWALEKFKPAWREASIHEFAPGGNALTHKLLREGRHYSASNFFEQAPLGQMVGHLRNEDAQALTFEDGCFDVLVSLDVLEHVDDPQQVLAEAARVLRVGGLLLFTTPTYAGQLGTLRRARGRGENVELLEEPEYHGNPISDSGSLVYHHFGHDLLSSAQSWSGCDAVALRYSAPLLGVSGEFTEVYALLK